MAYVILPVYAQDVNGNPYANAKLYLYQGGSNFTTLQAGFTDETGATNAANPYTTNGQGVGAVWLDDSATYDIIVKSADDSQTIWSQRSHDPSVNPSLIITPQNQGDQNLRTTDNVTFAEQEVTGNQTLGGNQTVGGTLGVTGAVTLGGNVTLNGLVVTEDRVVAVDSLTNQLKTGPLVVDVETVAEINTEIAVVSGITNEVQGVFAIRTEVAAVDANSANINAVNANAANINQVAGDATQINTIATDLSGDNDIGTVSTNISNVNTVAGDLTGDNYVGAIGADLAGANNVGTVGGSIANVNTVATDLTGDNNVGTVATDISNVNTTATNIADINTAAANITEIQNAPANAAQTTADAAVSQDALDRQSYKGSFPTLVAAVAAGHTVGDTYYNTTSGQTRRITNDTVGSETDEIAEIPNLGTTGQAVAEAETPAAVGTALGRLAIINKVYLSDFGSAANPVGQGVAADDTAALQAAALEGGVVYQDKGTDHLINACVSPVTDFTFVGSPDSTLQAQTGSGAFNELDYLNKNTTSANIFRMVTAGKKLLLDGVTFTTDGTAEPILRPVFIQGGIAEFGNIRVLGFKTANGAFSLNEMLAGTALYSFLVDGQGDMDETATTYTSLPSTYSPAGVVVDDAGTVRSLPILMDGFNIRNMNRDPSGAGLGQSDGMTFDGIGKLSPDQYPDGGHKVRNGEFYNLGEALDNFHDHCTYDTIYAELIRNAVIQMKHGGSHLRARRIHAKNCGFANDAALFGVSGSTNASAKPCIDNVIESAFVEWDADRTPATSIVLVQNSGRDNDKLAYRNRVDYLETKGADAAPALLKDNTTSAQKTAASLTASDQTQIIEHVERGTAATATYDVEAGVDLAKLNRPLREFDTTPKLTNDLTVQNDGTRGSGDGSYTIDFDRATPYADNTAADAVIGKLTFSTRDSNENKNAVTQLIARTINRTDGSEKGRLIVRLYDYALAGDIVDLDIKPDEMLFGSAATQWIMPVVGKIKTSPLAAAPSGLSAGVVAYSDGTASGTFGDDGAGPYFYNGTAWTPMFGGASLTDAEIKTAVDNEMGGDPWTPTLTTQGTDFTTVTYAKQDGHYWQVGKMVVGWAHLRATVTTAGSPSDVAVVGGWPVQAAGSVDQRINCACRLSIKDTDNASPSSATAWPTHPNYLSLLYAGGTQYARLGFTGNLSGDGYDQIASGDFTDGTTIDLFVSFAYEAA